MPITYWITMLLGTLALIGTPFFSGFYSKDTHHRGRAHHAHEAGNWVATYAYWAVLLGAFVTAFYSFRLLYLTFHGKERFHDPVPDHYVAPEADSTEHEAALAQEHEHDAHAHDAHGHGHDDHAHTPHESPWVVTLPLVLLAIPSVLIGFFTVGPMLFGTDVLGHHEQLPFFLGAIDVAAARDTMMLVGEEVWHGPVAYRDARLPGPGVLAGARRLRARHDHVLVEARNCRREGAQPCSRWPVRVLENKYGMDDLWIDGFAGGGLRSGQGLSRAVDTHVIDGAVVNGSARVVDLVARLTRRAAVRLTSTTTRSR